MLSQQNYIYYEISSFRQHTFSYYMLKYSSSVVLSAHTYYLHLPGQWVSRENGDKFLLCNVNVVLVTCLTHFMVTSDTTCTPAYPSFILFTTLYLCIIQMQIQDQGLCSPQSHVGIEMLPNTRGVSTVRKELFCTFTKDDHFSIKTWSNLKSKGSFGKLIQFCVQNCPWKLD